MSLGGQMFKEITAKYQVNAVRVQRPGHSTVLFEKDYLVLKIAPGCRIQVHSKTTGASNLINEVPIAAAQIKNVVRWMNIPREKPSDQNLPYRRAILRIGIETTAVGFFKLGAGIGERHSSWPPS